MGTLGFIAFTWAEAQTRSIARISPMKDGSRSLPRPAAELANAVGFVHVCRPTGIPKFLMASPSLQVGGVAQPW